MKVGVFHLSLKTIGRGSIKRPKRKKETSPVKTLGYDRGGKVTLGTKEGPIVCYYAKRDRAVLRFEDFGMHGVHSEDAWNMVEQVENRKDAQLAYRLIFAGSVALTWEQNWEAFREFAELVHLRYGAMVSLTAHGDNPDNPHGHMIVGQRRVTFLNGRLSFDRHKFDDLNPFVKKGTVEITFLRETYAQILNRALEKAKLEVRVNHRSHKDRGLDLMPTKHEGPKSRRLAKKHGILVGAAKQNQEISNANQATRRIKVAIDAKTQRRKDLIAVRDMPAALRAALADGIRVRAEDAAFRNREADRRAQEAVVRDRNLARIELEIKRREQALTRPAEIVVNTSKAPVATVVPPLPEVSVVGGYEFHRYLAEALKEIGEDAPMDSSPENFRFIIRDGIPTGLFFLNSGKGNRLIQIARYGHLRTAAEAAAATKKGISEGNLVFDDQLHEGDLDQLVVPKDLPMALGNLPKPSQEFQR